ncbi:putative receptor-like protein kinase At3g47110 [Diospyros lotus]|uniref:putative receptor-like protein kinase At3g47110 n=1 Tax=Diospyros lotus TaxID=55363 RepID=UPI0022510F46|nr:putative receptor-like protein kinase At3g47110 [Diospyros lotus]
MATHYWRSVHMRVLLLLHSSFLRLSQMAITATSFRFFFFFSTTFHGILTLLLFSLSLPNNAASSSLGNETDISSLLDFKSQIFEDPEEALASWNDTLHFCNWAGVTCGLKHRRVTALSLHGQKLVGTLSPAIGNLSFLQALDLSENSFRGHIPPELGLLFRLRNLNLSFNFLGGEVPANLSGCSSLLNLLLDHNYLIGHIPSQLGLLPNLAKLYLKNNNLTGNFPASIGNLTSLRELYLSYNNLEGKVPETISQLRNLTMIGLSVNSLSGVFPPSLYNLSSLQLLSLSFNNFSGNLREDIGLAFPNLQNLYLAENHFTGSIPVSLCNASQLQRLDLPINGFTGKVPVNFGNLQNLWWFNILENDLGSGELHDLDFLNSLTNCSQLQFLDIANNSFGGVLPSSITNLSTQMTMLLIGGNIIQGIIPAEIANLVNLTILSMPGNLLTGKIPASIGNLSNLKRLHLESNQLTGEIPSSLGNNTQLLNIYLQNNSLAGGIPSSLGNCKDLQVIDLSQNKLSGPIPKQILSLQSLSVLLNVSGNSLTGPLPEEVGNLTNLATLDVSNNRLSGQIPSSLGSCFSLEILLLQGNFFGGPIPALTGLKNIHYLDLSHNNLSGQIPQQISRLSTLFYLDLSFNNLEGQVPAQGIFKNESLIRVSGNDNLCGGIQDLHLHQCPDQSRKKSRNHIGLKLILVLVILAACLALMVSIFWFFCTRKMKNKPNSTSSIDKAHPKVSYEELLNATDGFSSRNLIGSGSFGTVYRGILNQQTVAIKVLDLEQRGASKSFIAECQALRNIRHRNLVKILTACSSIDFKGNDFKALVYEFCPNGCLEKWLHQEEREAPERSLSILQRLNIAIDVASSLDYLHNQCDTPVAHCDLKPSNVLLDDDFTARVSDFGLAQLLCKFSKDATMKQFTSLEIKGTIGYAPPEYGMGGRVSTEGDVYSYGVLLLELFTERRPTDDSFKDNLNLHNFVKMALPNRVTEIIDHSALNRDDEEISEVGCSSELTSELTECLVSVLQIGVQCSSDSPQDRLNMGQVAMNLLCIRDTLL